MTGHGRWPAATALTVALLLLAPGAAQAGGKFLGETVITLGDGGHEAWLIGQSQEVGYKYNYLAFVWVDLWTWGGTYCVHQRLEHRYVPITAAEAARLLKRDPADLRPPFWYRWPAGWLVFGPLAVLAGLARLVRGPAKPPSDNPPSDPLPSAAT